MNFGRVLVALGGGTARYARNADSLRGTGVMILLDADLGVLAERVPRADRPCGNPGMSPEEHPRRISSTAGHPHRQGADLVHRTDAGKEIEMEANELLDFLAARRIV